MGDLGVARQFGGQFRAGLPWGALPAKNARKSGPLMGRRSGGRCGGELVGKRMGRPGNDGRNAHAKIRLRRNREVAASSISSSSAVAAIAICPLVQDALCSWIFITCRVVS